MARLIGIVFLLTNIVLRFGLANAQCFYDEAAADLEGRRCNRDAACTGVSDKSDCKGNRRCRCDDICGLVCIKVFQDYFCDVSDLPELTIGLSYELSTDPVRFNTTATYSCGIGYKLSDDSLKVRRCRGDNRWSGETPTCLTDVACSTPEDQENARLEDDRALYAVGERIRYTCDFGYYQLGSGYITCELKTSDTAGWTDMDSSFECRPKSCGDPGYVRNGYRDGNIFTFAAEVFFYCNEGYKLTGRGYRVCQADGEWSGLTPSCKAVTCPQLSDPENGDVFGSDFSFGKQVRLTCSEGFIVAGTNQNAASVTCQANGHWDLSIRCEVVNCGDPGVPENGNRNGDDFGYNGYLLFDCKPGYKLYGLKSIYCQANNEWSADIPRCLLQCTLPAIPQHLEVPSSYYPGESVDVGTTYRINCRNGYTLLSDTNDWECIGGRMSFDPVCTESSCLPLNEISHGSITYTIDMEDGSYVPYTVAQYRCDIGYKLSSSGSPSRECRYGDFSGAAPACTETFCEVPDVQNGTPTTSRPVVGHNEEVVYTCNQGYFSDDSLTIRCFNENWSSIPVCREAPCPPLASELHLNVLYGAQEVNGVYEAGTEATFSCQSDLYYPTRTSGTCRLGKFPRVTCQQFATCDIETVEGATITYTDKDQLNFSPKNGVVREGILRSVRCTYPLTISGEHKSVCLNTGQWDVRKPSCEKPKCQIPQPPKYGYYASQNVGGSVTYPDTVAFGCEAPNSRIIGSSTVVCDRVVLHVGQCITESEFQDRHFCPVHVNPEHGWFSYSDSLKEGSKIRLGCYGSNYMATEAVFERTCIHNTDTDQYEWYPAFSKAPECILDSFLECRREVVRRGSQTFTASSYSSGNDPRFGRLYDRNGAWIPQHENIGQWLEVDLQNVMNVFGVKTQGHYYDNYWVTLYKVAYRLVDSEGYTMIENERGDEAIFVGNVDRKTPSQQLFSDKVRAQYVRIYPQEWYEKMSLRFGVVACQLTPEETACDIPPLLNSVLYVNNQRTIQSKADNHDSVIISCNQGYAFANGKNSITGTCIDSTINYEENIELVCEMKPTNGPIVEVKCPMPTVKTNTIVNVNDRYDLDDSIASDTMFPEGTILITRCRDIGKYILSNGGERRCLNGYWTGTPATCTYSYNKLLFKKAGSLGLMNRKVAPNSAYYMVEEDGKGIKIQCLVVDDAELSFKPDDGTTVLELEGDGVFSRSDIHYIISGKEHSGTYTCWDRDDNEKPRISVVVKVVGSDHCEEPVINNGRVSELTNLDPAGRLKTLSISCNLHYRLKGERFLQCRYDGEWDYPDSQCVYTICSTPPTEVLNGFVIGAGTSENSEVLVYCNDGFFIRGTDKTKQTSECREGKWVPTLPASCAKPTTCSDLPQEIENGYVLRDNTHGQVSVTILCKDKAVVSGTTDSSIIINCIDGQWDKNFPSACIYLEPQCSIPPVSIWNGIVSRQDDEVTLTCDAGYYLPGTSDTVVTVTCANGKWNNDNNYQFPTSCTDTEGGEGIDTSFSFSSDTNGETSSSSVSIVEPTVNFCSACSSESENAFCKKKGRIFPVNGRITAAEPAVDPNHLKVTIEVSQWLISHDVGGEPVILNLTVEDALKGDCYCPAGLGFKGDLRIYVRYNEDFKLVSKSYISQDTSAALPECS